ncbi:uncharacterized protein LOC135399146 [Ornithodoros turicata]|uniref:uncharacterized protein LOC135399146 n=1 Tax=Ornithodoros turicata TaxID=34597 RepID=UPI003138EFE8
MYPLFEVSRLLAIGPKADNQHPLITASAYGEQGDYSILVLICSNGYVLFYLRHALSPKPLMRQIPWSPPQHPHPTGDIAAICLNPTSSQLLAATTKSVIHVIPLAGLFDGSSHPRQQWQVDDTVGVRLSGNRAKPTCICWWESSEGNKLAVIGNEHGEVSFLDLPSRKEVGGTYVTSAVLDMKLTLDAAHQVTYLTITGGNGQHWQLLLEDRGSGYNWLKNCVRTAVLDGSGLSSFSEWRLWTPAQRQEQSGTSERPPHPKLINKLGPNTVLGEYTIQARQCIGAYDSSTSQLEVFDADVSKRALCVFAVPVPSADKVLLTDHLLITACNFETEPQLLLFSKSAVDLTSSSRKKECIDPIIQQFTLEEHVTKVYRCGRLKPSADVSQLKGSGSSFKRSLSTVFQSAQHGPGDTARRSSSFSGSASSLPKTAPDTIARKLPSGEDKKDVMTVALPSETFIDGCILVTSRCVYHCRPRSSAERLFLHLTERATTLPSAERLGALLGLDIFSLYEVAAELQLSWGQFPQAVRLYQLSKCPQLKRVAHFVSYGFLSELLAYMQVLFSTRASEITLADRVHFANIAALCFIQQVLQKHTQEVDSVMQAFRDFLQENLYYDDSVVMRMLCEQRLYGLLRLCALLRGQRQLMLELLLNFNPTSALDEATCSALTSRGYGSLLVQSANADYVWCVTDPDLLLPLSRDLSLLSSHLRVVADLLPSLDTVLVERLARLYDASRHMVKIAIRRVLACSKHGRYPGSLSSLSTDSLDLTQSEDDSVNEEDLIKFFIFVLLMLNYRRGGPKHYTPALLSCTETSTERSTERRHRVSDSDRSIACGQLHAAYVAKGKAYTWGKALFGRLGHKENHREIFGPACVEILDSLRVKVSQVSCGTHHTLFNTDCGVFACGSSRYGQLGLGVLQRTWIPQLIETLAGKQVSKIACGLYHSLALTTSGRLFTWGWGVHGQLGHGGCSDERRPRLVSALTEHAVIDAYGGNGHSVALTKEGAVFTFGCGTFGQLGTGSTVKRSTPQRVKLDEPVRLVTSGYFQVFAVCHSGKVLTWGANPQSLRLQAQSSRRSRLQAVVAQNELLFSSASGGAGMAQGNLRDASSSAASSVGSAAAWRGSQQHLSPSEMDVSAIQGNIVQVACGANHAAIIVESGELYMWGRNTEGQLGLGNRKDQKSPQLVSHLSHCKLAQVCCGRDSTIALDIQGKVWAWGQNDSGQLGLKVNTDDPLRNTKVLASRLITIRTNRRLITIPQGQRTGEVKPQHVSTLPTEAAQPLDPCCLEAELPLRQKVCYNAYLARSVVTPNLSSLDDPPYGPKALHTALKVFHGSYDPTTVVNHCNSFGDSQAAAKVCLLEGQFAQAVQYQFRAQLRDAPIGSDVLLQRALEAVTYYMGLVDKENCEVNRGFFENVVVFWMDSNLSVEPLENLFRSYLPDIGYCLGLVLFCYPHDPDNQGGPTTDAVLRFAKCLTTSFCLRVSSALRDQVSNGRRHAELIDILLRLSGTGQLLHQIRLVDETAGWDAAVPPNKLREQIVRCLQQGAARKTMLKIPSTEVEQLTKALLAERANMASPSVTTPKDPTPTYDTVVFSCGHQHTASYLRTSLLPELEKSMLTSMPRPLPITTKLLLKSYELEGTIPLACPRCVVAEVRDNW